MTNNNDLEKDLYNNTSQEYLNDDLADLQDEINELEENEEIVNKENWKVDDEEIIKLKELLARTQADYQNFKFRSERDRQDMIFFIKSDIFKKILPRIDDLERMIKNTKDEEKTWVLFQWVLAMEKALKRDLDSMWVKPFNSIWSEINPDMHEVMTQVPSETSWIIVDEFEKWYMLGDRVLRVAKVIVGA